MNTNDAIETAHAFPGATIVPVHYEGWAHFTQDRADLEQSFKALRLQPLERGVRVPIAQRQAAST
jgi:hypothetical protein